MQKLLIFPFNGNAIEAIDCIGKKYELLGFIDDTKEKQGKNKFGFEVFSREKIKEFPDSKILAVPGSPQSFLLREKIISGINSNEKKFATVIHPSAKVSPFAKIGYNVLIMAGVVITSNAVIGNHICILPNSVIHHDTIIGDYTLVGSNVTIAGNVNVGKNCYIGSGSSIINGISIGEKTLIGMGTNVIKSFPANSKLVGNPARQI